MMKSSGNMDEPAADECCMLSAQATAGTKSTCSRSSNTIVVGFRKYL
jgi:hypothetical protein